MICTVQNDVYYIPGFLAEEEAKDLLARIDEMPSACWTDLKRRSLQNHGGSPHPDGKVEVKRMYDLACTLFSLAGDHKCLVHPAGMVQEPVPRFIHQIFGLLVESGVFPEDRPPNHVLINSYNRGQGIAPHQDGPLYEPLVAILSLDGPALLQFWPPRIDADGVALAPDLNASSTDREPSTSVLCEPNSLVVFRGDAYRTHWHGILPRDHDMLAAHTGNLNALSGELRGATPGARVERKHRRVSLTVRRVLKVLADDARIFTEHATVEQKRKDQWWLAGRGEEGLTQGFI